jgi:hypothetical protein
MLVRKRFNHASWQLAMARVCAGSHLCGLYQDESFTMGVRSIMHEYVNEISFFADDIAMFSLIQVLSASVTHHVFVAPAKAGATGWLSRDTALIRYAAEKGASYREREGLTTTFASTTPQATPLPWARLR